MVRILDQFGQHRLLGDPRPGKPFLGNRLGRVPLGPQRLQTYPQGIQRRVDLLRRLPAFIQQLLELLVGIRQLPDQLTAVRRVQPQPGEFAIGLGLVVPQFEQAFRQMGHLAVDDLGFPDRLLQRLINRAQYL